MRIFFILIFVVLTSSVSQAFVCDESWKNQNAKHVQFFQESLSKKVKELLINAYRNIDVELTDQDIDFNTKILSSEKPEGFGYFDTYLGYNLAHVKTSGTVTDFIVIAAGAQVDNSNDNFWKVRTVFGYEELHNSIGDIVGYMCSTSSYTMDRKDRIQRFFEVSRVTTGFNLGTISLGTTRNLDEEVDP